jgi:UDP-3-O-[3-hydroxymyristoyl] N-acetylglucosamine deacetylase/3-hydroxyacyl-[acyl-carrier-protein] dehydratase
MSQKQTTLAKECSYSGKGIHSGEETTVTFKPASADTGVVFVRTDIEGNPRIPARIENAAEVDRVARRTILTANGVEVNTVEHILAALAGMGVDNVEVHLDSSEAADPSEGSSAPLVSLLTKAGLTELDLPKRFIKVVEAVSMRQGEVELVALPSDSLDISFTIDYDNKIIGTQYASIRVTPESFSNEVAPARTFALFDDVDRLREQGLIKGGSLENSVVVAKDHILNEEPLRFPDEFVRHKILDFIGDLFLLGHPVKGRFIAVRSGHAANVRFIRKLKEGLKRGKLSMEEDRGLGLEMIQKIMPHRYPMLLVDRILELTEKRVVGIKNVTFNEPFFVGHFPGHPIMPAVLIIEAMAQVGGVLLLSTVERPDDHLVYFMGIDSARFRKPVHPGDQVRFELELLKLRKPICKMRGEAYVDGEMVADAELWSRIVDR